MTSVFVVSFFVFVFHCLLSLPVKDWALLERCKSCSDVCLKGGHGQCLGYQNKQ